MVGVVGRDLLGEGIARGIFEVVADDSIGLGILDDGCDLLNVLDDDVFLREPFFILARRGFSRLISIEGIQGQGWSSINLFIM
ncbi:hypothetical protein RCL_jg16075.t1 [Rhizophagus clarus]|uniref:Uncharacterized protein n=1 Tax=Rhizophagus clarus TaxID=94130 RepID=A0A8H3LCW6_9GLOM|nr:hypothetical protein RCL_jg16075.t1 [Rhizophagus clarus]